MVSFSSSPRIKVSPFVSHPSIIKSLLYTALAVLGVAVAIHSFGFVPILVVFGTIALHEYGHYWLSKKFDIPVEEIRFSLLGGSVVQEEEASTRALTDVVLYAIGPLFGLSSLLLFYPIAFYTGAEPLITICQLVVFIHLFNCVPYGSFDGAGIRDAITNGISSSRFVPGFTTRPLSWVVTFVHLVVLAVVATGFGYAISLL